MKIFFAAVAVSLIGVGCVPIEQKPIEASRTASMQGKSIVVVNRKAKHYEEVTLETSIARGISLFGAALAHQQGDLFRDRNGLTDPALNIARSLAGTFATNNGLKVMPTTVSTSVNTVSSVKKAAGAADFAIDVGTIYWGHSYDSFLKNPYLVQYIANVRLIDVHAGKVIMSDNCKYNSKKQGLPTVSLARIKHNKAAYVKTMLENAQSFCSEQFLASL